MVMRGSEGSGWFLGSQHYAQNYSSGIYFLLSLTGKTSKEFIRAARLQNKTAPQKMNSTQKMLQKKAKEDLRKTPKC